MTQEDKKLLLQDLCARLPYSPICHIIGENGTEIDDILTTSTIENLDVWVVKPYLRPMLSMTEEEAKELLFVRLASKYGESCAYIKNFIKLNEVSFQKKSPYKGSISVWFSFENKIHDTLQTREYSKCEYLGQINDVTVAEIDWLNAHYFDYRGLIPKGLALSTDEFNPYKDYERARNKEEFGWNGRIYEAALNE